MKKFMFVVVVLGLVAGGFVLMSRRAVAPSDTPVPEPSAESEVTFGIQGRWMSLDDDRSVMVFGAGGAYEDFYDGVSVGAGTWELDRDMLTKYMDGDSLIYAVLELTEDDLVLSYTARGNTLRYIRVVELQ